ncbi:MAG: DUF3169 family protein [Solibacillus sp.]|uniref:DUF3169 family protein n=1 Tax=Solibacillus sp. TaxID=1909654 RepID=UPI0033149048
MILLTIAIILAFFCTRQLWTSYDFASLQEIVFLCGNLVSSVFLVIAGIYYVYITRGLKKNKEIDDEDYVLNTLERKMYHASYFVLTALIIGFISVATGFMYFRNDQPEIVLFSFIITMFSLFFFISNSKVDSLTFPNFKAPDPQSKTPIADTLEYYDDGQKYLLLKALYKLYFLILTLMVFLIFGLMYYSVFTGNNQTVSIIGIGVILLISLLIFTSSLMPQKLQKNEDA